MTMHSELHHTYRARARRIDDLATAVNGLQQLLIDAHSGAQHFLAAPANALAERVAGGDTSDPTLAAVFARAWVNESLDEIDEQLDEMIGEFGSIATIRAELSKLAAAGRQATSAEEPKRTNMVDCMACTRTITMTPADRPRAGYCNACRMAWKRLEQEWDGPGAPDRAQFERTRAQWRGIIDETATIRVIGSRITEITRNGRTVTLTEHQSTHLLSFGPTPPEHEIDALFDQAI